MISPTRQELVTSLVQYVSQATGLDETQVMRGNQNAPSPLGVYASILYVSDAPFGTDEIATREDPDDPTALLYTIRGCREYTFNLQFFRDNATDLAKLVMQHHLTPAGVIFLQEAPFTFRMVDSVSENAQVINQNFEDRAILILRLWVTETQTLTVPVVCGVDLTQTVTDGAADLTQQCNVHACEHYLTDNDGVFLTDNDGTFLIDNDGCQ